PDLAAWIDAPGLPDSAPVVPSDALDRVASAARAWAEGKTDEKALDTRDWTTHHWLHFLRSMPERLSAAQMARLDAAFGFTKTGNTEILDEWLVLAVRHGYKEADARMEEFLTSMGRRKYLTPVYKELMKTEEGAARARAIYAKAWPLYHTIARQTLDEIVK
ncbi:MAG TPA: leukotriene A4 hydrolase C-terminal domain-containing protein, partial [Candidatus Polarisedimenticolia bacterium]|nr:leukotriene A4 hydrolase C-terminal domain-containing protein [Candidatus Polarisedimenticolia bacterium]